jgi:hypothetical protein
MVMLLRFSRVVTKAPQGALHEADALREPHVAVDAQLAVLVERASVAASLASAQVLVGRG